MFIMQAKLLMLNKDCCPINIKVYRTLFDDQLMILTKNKEDLFRKEMCQQAPQQLVQQRLSNDNNLANTWSQYLMVFSAIR